MIYETRSLIGEIEIGITVPSTYRICDIDIFLQHIASYLADVFSDNISNVLVNILENVRAGRHRNALFDD